MFTGGFLEIYRGHGTAVYHNKDPLKHKRSLMRFLFGCRIMIIMIMTMDGHFME